MQLSDKNILLTGASGGIGQALASALSQQGARLILVARNRDKLETVLAALSSPRAGSHCIYPCDLGNRDELGQLITFCQQQANDQSKGIDILINNAAQSWFSHLEDCPTSQIEAIISTNLSAPIQLIQGLLPQLKARPEAAILNIGSTLASVAYPGYSVYCGSKFGLRGFTEALRRELSDTAVKVLYAAPRATDTDILSQRERDFNAALGNQIDEPQQVATSICAQLQSGQDINIIGGTERFASRFNSLLPGVVDKAIRKQLTRIKPFLKVEQV